MMIEKLIEFDTFLFRLINNNGDKSFDMLMILLSDKFIFIPLYLYILYIFYLEFLEKISLDYNFYTIINFFSRFWKC